MRPVIATRDATTAPRGSVLTKAEAVQSRERDPGLLHLTLAIATRSDSVIALRRHEGGLARSLVLPRRGRKCADAWRRNAAVAVGVNRAGIGIGHNGGICIRCDIARGLVVLPRHRGAGDYGRSQQSSR